MAYNDGPACPADAQLDCNSQVIGRMPVSIRREETREGTHKDTMGEQRKMGCEKRVPDDRISPSVARMRSLSGCGPTLGR
eukprot:2675783-Pyramimonas_sp.AAC.1